MIKSSRFACNPHDVLSDKVVLGGYKLAVSQNVFCARAYFKVTRQ